MNGFHLEVVYDQADPQPLGLGSPPWSMDIDPLSGRLFVAQTTLSGGGILWIDPISSEAGLIPFFSQALGFADDGTLYFGVGNFILGTWQRGHDQFRKFAIIPGVRGVQVLDDRDLFVAEASFGPNGLYPDSVLRVNRGDGFFEPVWSKAEAESQTGLPLNVMTALAIDTSGTIYAGYHTGELIAKRTDNRYASINRRLSVIGGLNEFALTAGPEGLVYQYDVAGGELFVIQEDGGIRLLAYGDGIKGRKFSNGAIAADHNQIYLTADYQVLYRIVSPQSIASQLMVDNGTGLLKLLIIDQFTAKPVANARVSLQDGTNQTSDDRGELRLDLPAELFEAKIEKQGYRPTVVNFRIEPNQDSAITIRLNPGLPEYLAPGLKVEIVGSQISDQVDGSSDVAIGPDGHVLSMNFGNGSITHHLMEASPGVGSSIVATGGGLANSFVLEVDSDYNVYASIGNDGVMKIPFVPGTPTFELEIDPSDPTRVVDQFGVEVRHSLVRDVDGIAMMSQGSLIFSSGAGGSPISQFPDGTFNSLVRRDPNGSETIFSRGIPSAGGAPLFDNNDIVKVDKMDRLMVGNRTGNVVLVHQDGSAELIWPGNGEGKPDGLGSFSCLNSDDDGMFFIRGDTGDGTASVIRMISADGNQLITVAAGLTQCFGGFEFDDDSRTLVISDDVVVLKITSLDGRTIAENLIHPPNKIRTNRSKKYRQIQLGHRHRTK